MPLRDVSPELTARGGHGALPGMISRKPPRRFLHQCARSADLGRPAGRQRGRVCPADHIGCQDREQPMMSPRREAGRKAWACHRCGPDSARCWLRSRAAFCRARRHRTAPSANPVCIPAPGRLDDARIVSSGEFSCRRHRAAGSAFAATRWHGADPVQERAGQQVQNPDRPPPPYPGIARKLLISQGNTVWRPVLPDGLGADAENRPARGQNGKTSTDPRPGGGGELAMPHCCRGPLIAAIRAVEIGANAHLSSHARTVGGDGHGDLVGGKARQGQRGLALLRDGDRYALTCRLLVRASVGGLGGIGAHAAPHACYIHIRHLPCHRVTKPATSSAF